MIQYSSQALVDYSGLGKTVRGIRESFSMPNFFDFCSFIEGVILYDKLMLVGSLEARAKVPAGAVNNIDEALKPLLHEMILIEDEGELQALDLGTPPSRKTRDRKTKMSVQDAWYETGRLLAAEQKYRIPSLPLLRQKVFYEKTAHVVEDHSICDLFGKHKDLDSVLSRIRKSTLLPTAEYISVPIPTLPLAVLQRSRNIADLPIVTLEVRDEYKPLRASLRDLRQTLADLSIAPSEKLRAIESWMKSWKTLARYESQASFFEMATASNNMIDISKSLGGIGLDSIKWSKIIETIIGLFEKSFYEWRIRQLHKSAKNYLATSEVEFSKEIYRLFGYQISDVDREALIRAEEYIYRSK